MLITVGVSLSVLLVIPLYVAFGATSEKKCPAVDPWDHTVLLPDPTDCRYFFMCSNGVPIRQKCPEGLHFNATLNVCDWPQNAGCEEVTGFLSGCLSGGEGSTSCSIEGGVDIPGGGVTAGCSVSCADGYYACCTFRCTCKEI